jgi:hypothetical protein
VLSSQLPRPNFRRQLQRLRKSPTLAKTAMMGHPTSKANFEGERDKYLRKKNGINNCVYPVLR